MQKTSAEVGEGLNLAEQLVDGAHSRVCAQPPFFFLFFLFYSSSALGGSRRSDLGGTGIHHGCGTMPAVSVPVWAGCGNESKLLRPAIVSPPSARPFTWDGKRNGTRVERGRYIYTKYANSSCGD